MVLAIGSTIFKTKASKNVQADVIILGCSLPGIVAAHKLRRKLGDTMVIVVLDLVGPSRFGSKCGVAFLDEPEELSESPESLGETVEQIMDNVAKHYISMFAKNFNIPLPDSIISPEKNKSSLNKIFQHVNGTIVECFTDYHNFDYVNFLQKFELNQYQTRLDQNMRALFQMHRDDTEAERKRMLYYDRTTMEQYICSELLFPTSRNIMRTIVRLVCGAPPDSVSVLFYLHQCQRTSSGRNHLDGNNTRFREKLLGYCRKHLAVKLQQSIADITLTIRSVKQISTYANEKIILKTIKGESNYVCNLLAMALRPDELNKIQVDNELFSDAEAKITKAMKSGKVKKFMIQYEECFWQKQGYSGDILSMQGPILWAIERPNLSTTGSSDKYASIIGYLKVMNKANGNESKEAVVEQLVKLFGEDAANPVNYRESEINDVFVPRCGDYVALRSLTGESRTRHLEWGALDIFAEGDVAAALEAGHATYLHLLSSLRPQAQTFEDVSATEWPTMLSHDPLTAIYSQINYMSTMRFAIFTVVIYSGIQVLKSYFRDKKFI